MVFKHEYLKSNYNNGNISYELLIRKNTIISNLGKYEPIQKYTEKPISIKLYEILNTSQRVSTLYYRSIVYIFLNKIKETFKVRAKED